MGGYVKEVVLENFMSYRYARIRLSPGLNIITGPNGAGKSSILLGLSVALGQTYTERGRRLGDLIRRGEDVARVTAVIDNRPVNGRRPIPWIRSDEVFFTRYIRSDGQYWHEVNGRVTPKVQVARYLSRIGLDPDNMMIIMHQNMIEEFVYKSPQEKLGMVEAASGLQGYRDRILAAMRRLQEGKAERDAVLEKLTKAKETLEYWGGIYEKYLERRRIEERIRELQRELRWARVRDARVRVEELQEELGRIEEKLRWHERELRRLRQVEAELRGQVEEGRRRILSGDYDVAGGLEALFKLWEAIAATAADSRENEVLRRIYVEEREFVLDRLRKASSRVEQLRREALESGEEVTTSRAVEEIEQEIRERELALASLGEIPANIEEAYRQFEAQYASLKEKWDALNANIARAEKELEERVQLWRGQIEKLVSSVGEEYARVMTRIGARGYARLVGMDDVERAGLEILVDFAGTGLMPLDPYTHSGGERTTATMCFFLALQRHVKSPLRAIDEFDVHMDPRNREAIMSMILEMAEGEMVQYIVITPGLLSRIPENANIILVQKARGGSVTARLGA